MTLVEHDENLFSAEHEFGWQGGLIRIPVRMTVIRLRAGPLILHSPIPIPPDLREALDALGPVGFIVVPEAHGRFAEEAVALYPDAVLLAAPDLPRRRRSRLVDASPGTLADQPPAAWKGEVECLLLNGFRLHEVLLFHAPSRTLILTDLCFNIRSAPSRASGLFFRANGMWQHFGPSRIIRRIGVSDRKSFRASVERACAWDFTRIVPGHGEVIEPAGPELIREAWW